MVKSAKKMRIHRQIQAVLTLSCPVLLIPAFYLSSPLLHTYIQYMNTYCPLYLCFALHAVVYVSVCV